MELSEAIGRALDAAFAASRAREVPTAGQMGPAALLDTLKARFGVSGAAREAGIDRRTMQRAVNRTGAYKPTPRTLERLRSAYERLRPELVERERARAAQSRGGIRTQLTRKGGNLRISGVFCVSQDCRPRTLNLSPTFTATTRAGIVRAYEDRDLELAAQRFDDGLNRDYLETESGGMYTASVRRLDWSA